MSNRSYPSVVNFDGIGSKKNKHFILPSEVKRGVYRILWPAWSHTAQNERNWWQSLFGIDTGTHEVEHEEETVTYFYESSTEIFEWPSMKPLRFGEDDFELIKRAVHRFHIQLEMGDDFPGDAFEDDDEDEFAAEDQSTAEEE